MIGSPATVFLSSTTMTYRFGSRGPAAGASTGSTAKARGAPVTGDGSGAVGLSVALGVSVGTAVAVEVGVTVGLVVAVGVAVGVAVALGVSVTVGAAVARSVPETV